MSWMGSMPRSSRTMEILKTHCDSCSALAARSPLTLSTSTRALSNSADRSHPSVGCKSRSSSSNSIASGTSRSISCRQRKIGCSSNVRPSLVSCLDLELETRAWAKKSYWTASAHS
jgi:hypothetical protein